MTADRVGAELEVTGLTAAVVAQRRSEGRVNDQEVMSSRSVRDIVRSNLLTRFNAIISVLATIVLVFGHPIDALFGLVMVANIIIGIVQELRAKRTLDGLRVLIAPTVIVRRDGTEQELPVDQVVLGDVLCLVVGDQIPVDGNVLSSGGLEVDESALTGESVPVPKLAGDQVRSGSAVLAGRAAIETTHVGADAWVHQLVVEAKTFVLTRSELRAGVDRLLQVISWILGPLALLLFWSQLRGDADVAHGLVAATAGVVALVPQGLVLLVSVAMAVAVVGLARRSVVVQELPAVEGLARADIVCVDKTGTLTTGRTHLERIEPLAHLDADGLAQGLAALASTEESPTAAMAVIAAATGTPPGWRPTGVVPFSSGRKWSAASFDGVGTWLLGAPEVLLTEVAKPSAVDRQVADLARAGHRVLLVATSTRPIGGDPSVPVALPGDLLPVGLVVMAEEVRGDAADTMRYFADQGVSVKVISGDNAETVAAVARGLGLPGADAVIDLRTVSEIDGVLAEAYTVFGRVQPEQKRRLVQALQSRGHVVAMTGDGVNDIPALKAADIGIAMDTATSATKAVSQLILLNGRFDLLPGVVAEGRRVVANMERVSSLFVAKTVYAALLALVVGVGGIPFPFLPRQLTLIDSLTIGVPAFVLSFRGSDQRCRSGYLRRVIHFAAPVGVVAALVTITTYGLAFRLVGATLEEARTAATLALVAIGFWILYRLIRPLDLVEAGLLATLVAAAVLIAVVPVAAEMFALERLGGDMLVVVASTVLVGALGTRIAIAVRSRWWGVADLERTFVPVPRSRWSAGWSPASLRRRQVNGSSHPTQQDSGPG